MSKYTRILSIDGGGLRGIIPAAVLVELEKKLQKKAGKSVRIADYFDLIAGTSTGGILTCLFLAPDNENPERPMFSAIDALNLYLEWGDEIFSIPVKHRIATLGGTIDEKFPADGLIQALSTYLGDLELKDLLRPCLVTAYDIKRREAFFFTQTTAKKKKENNYRVVDVARATSAAPTYFECAMATSKANTRHPLVDGGVFANNPTLCAYAEARKMPGNPTAKDMAILSLGTGEIRKPYSYNEAKDWGLLDWIKPLVDIMMTAGPSTVDYQLKMIYDAVGAHGQYLRVQQSPIPAKNAEMDNADADNLQELREIGSALAKEHDSALDQFVELLVAE